MKSGTSDICLPNGLCKNEYVENGLSVTSYWHDLCTSKDWPEASCLQVYYSNTTNPTFALTPCDGTENSEEWCPGSNTTSCCGTGDAVTIASVLKDWATSTPQSSGGGLSTGAVAGFGVGAGMAGVVLGAAIMFFLVRRRQKVPSYSVPNDGGQVPVTKHLPEPAGSVADVHYNHVYETEAIGRHELPSYTDRR